MSAMEAFRAILNGPVVAGVGATVDPGLIRDKYHIVPWDPTRRVQVELTVTEEGRSEEHTSELQSR